MTHEEKYRTHFTIRDALKILDSTPIQRDLVQEVNFVQLANRAPIAHLNIEKGIKSLIFMATGKLTKTHALNVLYEELRACDSSAAEFLFSAFNDSVNCFDINTKFDQYKHLVSIQEYLGKAGSKSVFDELRYWSMGESDGSNLFQFIVLPIHRELLYALHCYFQDTSSDPHVVSNRVEHAVHRAMYSNMSWSNGEREKEKSIRWYTDWLFNQQTSFRDAIRQAVNLKFEIKPGDFFIIQTLQNALEKLQKSEDLAVRHFGNSLTYLPRGSQNRDPNAVPVVDWWNDSRTKGTVITPGGTNLGHIEQYADKSWGIIAYSDAMVKEIAMSAEDAKYYLVNYFTQEVDFEVNGVATPLRIIKKELYEKSPGFVGDLARMEREEYALELWDNTHGLHVGDKISVPLPTADEQFLDVLFWVSGKIANVQGKDVLVSGMGVYDLR